PIWSPADRHHARLEQTSGRLVFPSADTNHGALGVASGGVGRHAHGGVSVGDHGSGGHRGAHVSGVRVPRVHGGAVIVHVEETIHGRIVAHVLPRSGVTSAHRGPHDRAIVRVDRHTHGRGGASLTTARGSGREGTGHSGEVSGTDETLSVRSALSGDSQAMHTEAIGRNDRQCTIGQRYACNFQHGGVRVRVSGRTLDGSGQRVKCHGRQCHGTRGGEVVAIGSGRQDVLSGACERVRHGGVPVVGGRLFVAHSGSCGLLRLTGGAGGAVGGAVCAACGAVLQGDGVSGGGGGGHGCSFHRGVCCGGRPC